MSDMPINILKGAIVVLYLIFGITLLFSPLFAAANLAPVVRYGMGAALLIYGMYRGYMLVAQNKSK
jgi:hypothetical protein